MKKGNKKLLVLALLLLLVTATFGTYAIYRIVSTGTGSVTTAAWAIKLNGTSQTSSSKTFTFTSSDINWTTNTSAVNGKIAPGSTGTITIELDATGSEVNVAYDVAISSIKVNNVAISNDAGFTVALNSSDTGKLAYAASNMKKNIVLDVTWTGSESDESTKDNADIGLSNKEVEIAVDVTVKQDLGV